MPLRSSMLAPFWVFLMLLQIKAGAEAIGCRPNVLWITGEDTSASWLGCYGNNSIQTPNFDRLAKEGFLYTHCFAHTPVCAPARSGWITGIHPVSAGTVYMRSYNALPEFLVWYPDALRSNGYFAANATKTDYNTSNRKAGGFGGGKNEGTVGHFLNTWDSYEDTWWRNPKRKPNQPFFQVINGPGAHESVLHRVTNTYENVDPAQMKLAAYHPDIPEIREDYARYTAAVMAADKALGRILEKLEKDGLADDTIVIYSSDHGGVLGRSKRFLYDSGTRAALIVRIPEKFKYLWPAATPGTRIERLVSFLDLPKTWLAITHSKIPSEMQGKVFLGEKQEEPSPHVFIGRERMDEVPDMQRALRDSRYLYLRSYEPFRPDGQYLEYLWKAPSMRAWEAFHRAGKTDALTGAFFEGKAVEQLFDCEHDPQNVRNLAGEGEQVERLAKMRKALKEEQLKNFDCGFIPEGILLQRVIKYKTTIYEFIRNPLLYNQTAYMQAADLANFAEISDLPQLVSYLRSPDAGFRYWGVLGCIQLGGKSATPEVLALMSTLLGTTIDDEETLDVRVSAALYLCRIGQDKTAALNSLAEVIAKSPPKAAARGRAWSNVYLLGTEASEIVTMLGNMQLRKNDMDALMVYVSRLPRKSL